MYKNKIISVVVPAFNERVQIRKVIETMPEFIDKIIIIDDCSSDGMSDVVNEYVAKSDKVVLIRHEVNQGVGGAIASGYKWSRDNNIDVSVVMAGDGQMDPKDLPAILDPVVNGECDYSKANRLLSPGAVKEIPTIRLFGNSVLSLLTKIASGYWHISDSQTGYTAINREALMVIDWDSMYKRYGQPNDLIVKLNIHNFRVRDVITRPVYNVGEKSKLKIRRAVFTISWLLLKLFCYRLKEKYILRDFHPLVFFYALGLGMIPVTIAFFVRLVYLWAEQGSIPQISFLTLLFCITTTLNSLFFAMWFDMQSNKHLK
ncbi:glycosyltransferase family 2 protein [Bdellovibrio reynosensis]|uniref:Glycosyltransferase family 2 protein n=1 Tax=Bdellovibrio reynosensis TaxID=2835041 RepID=A0ABY4CBF1_9BACT|nr:glycosyltransferase family 2 protein [Bdellovibrio reynosensis]UOF02235.1 glycosyltransferase family 2 protein [Bdellovibrio reynosensis]